MANRRCPQHAKPDVEWIGRGREDSCDITRRIDPIGPGPAHYDIGAGDHEPVLFLELPRMPNIICINPGDEVAPSDCEANVERLRLPEVFSIPDVDDPGVSKRPDDVRRAVRATVVDDDELERVETLREHTFDGHR